MRFALWTVTLPRIMSAAFSATIITGELRFPEGLVGKMDASTTLRPWTPFTLWERIKHKHNFTNIYHYIYNTCTTTLKWLVTLVAALTGVVGLPLCLDQRLVPSYTSLYSDILSAYCGVRNIPNIRYFHSWTCYRQGETSAVTSLPILF